MSGGEQVDQSQLKGLSKYFNGVTDKGRGNVSYKLLFKYLKLFLFN